MNPFPLIVAELRCNAQGCAAIVVLIAVAVALGIALSAQDRALTLASAGAAAGFQIVGQVDAALAGTHDLMRAVAFAFDGLVVTAVLLTIVAVLSGRRQSIGVLRALGAPPAFLFVTVWLHGVLLVGAGTLLGVGLGFVMARALSAFASVELGHAVDARIGMSEWIFAAAVFGAGSLLAAAPSLPLLRVPAARLLRQA